MQTTTSVGTKREDGVDVRNDPKIPPPVSAVNHWNIKAILIATGVTLLAVIIFVFVLAFALRNLRRWKRVYTVHTKEQIQAIVEYDKMETSQDTKSPVHITILNESKIGGMKENLFDEFESPEKALLHTRNSEGSIVKI